MDFVDEPGLGDLPDLVEAEGPDDRAPVRNNLDHPLHHEALERLMNGSAPDSEHCGELQLVDVFAWFQGAGDDAELDRLAGLVAQRHGMSQRGALGAAIDVSRWHHRLHGKLDRRLSCRPYRPAS